MSHEFLAITKRTNIFLFGANATYVWYADKMFEKSQDGRNL